LLDLDLVENFKSNQCKYLQEGLKITTTIEQQQQQQNTQKHQQMSKFLNTLVMFLIIRTFIVTLDFGVKRTLWSKSRNEER
jgi:hypothetical protein